MVRERNFAGHRRRAAAGERHGARRMVRRTEDARRPALWCELPDQTEHRRGLQRLVGRHRRQDAGEALRQHGLAGPRRSHQQHAVAAGGGDLERALGGELALDVEQIRVDRRCQAHHRLVFGNRAGRGIAGVGAQVLDHLQQRARRKDRDAADQRGLVGAFERDHEPAPGADRVLGLCDRVRHGQRATHRPQFTRQRQLASKFVLVECARRNLAGRRQDAERDRQVEASRLLRQVGWCEIDGDAPGREVEAAGQQCRTHALARFPHLGVGQTHQGEGRQAVRQMDLDRHLRRIHAGQAAGTNDGDRHGVGSSAGDSIGACHVAVS